MTLTELKSLTGSQLRILVAEAEGWKYSPLERMGKTIPRWVIDGVNRPSVPRYDTDRDAITEAILRRLDDPKFVYAFENSLLCFLFPMGGENKTSPVSAIATASAEDLCRAFISSLTNPSGSV